MIKLEIDEKFEELSYLYDLFENITRIDYVPLEYRNEIKQLLIKAYKDGNQEFEKIHEKLKRLEKLKKENQEFSELIAAATRLKIENEKLRKENKELKENEKEINSYNSKLMAMDIRLKKENHDLKEQLEINETLSNAFEKQAFKVVHDYEQLKNAIKKFIEYLHKEPDRAIRKHSILQIFNKFLKEVVEE